MNLLKLSKCEKKTQKNWFSPKNKVILHPKV